LNKQIRQRQHQFDGSCLNLGWHPLAMKITSIFAQNERIHCIKEINMLKQLLIVFILLCPFVVAIAQKNISVPVAVKSAFLAKYPEAKLITWEKEKGNYEANWGGRSGEDHSVLFTPSGDFIQIVDAVSIGTLPAPITSYIHSHFSGAIIKEAGRVTDAKGRQNYEVEIKGRDLLFDLDGKYLGKGQ
jgi:hypothetical protein